MPNVRPVRVVPIAALAALAALAAVLAVAAGCAGPAGPAGGAVVSARPTSATPETAVDAPAATSAMICADEADEDISAALGTAPSQPPDHTWSDHIYTCRYHYSAATLVLSVTQLPDLAAALAYYAARRAASPAGRSLPGLGEEAFSAPDGSIVARKDTSVLQVDVTGLPDRFGPLQLTRAAVSLTVASVVMACWSGA